MTTSDIAWLAGLAEGEGCFLAFQSHKSTHPWRKRFTFVIASSDEDVILKVKRLFGSSCNMCVSRTMQKNGHKASYRVTISGSSAIAWMMTIYTLMGIRRKKDIRSCISQWKEYKPSFEKKYKDGVLINALGR